MSFWIYKIEGETATRHQGFKLTGRNGILADYLRAYEMEETPCSWQLTNAQLLERIDPTLDASHFIIVIDLLPESFTEACLYRVTNIQGSSEVDESDVVIACKVLYQGAATGCGDKVPVTTQDNDRQLLEAMRLTGGTMSGNYFWAKPKMDIGAAVCPAT